jgi:hypothetical protein
MAGFVDLAGIPTEILVDELQRRRVLPRCGCGMHPTVLASYDPDGHTLRCRGCLLPWHRCVCNEQVFGEAPSMESTKA